MNGSKKTYYVIKQNGEFVKDGSDGLGLILAGTPANALHFSTVADAIRRIEKRAEHYGPARMAEYGIVRVDETPAVPSRRLLGELEAAKEGETVKYATHAIGGTFPEYLRDGAVRGNAWTYEKAEAALFSDQAEAINAFIKLRDGAYEFVRPSVARIAVSAGSPVVTLTVLA